jgi:hypothetical protein
MGAVTVDLSGPLFDGRAQHELDAMLVAIVDDVAAQGYSEWMANLNGSIKHPTPYYETQITTDRHGDSAVVHDRGIVYGPWLEGTGSRNKTTRFKGYASARRAVATLETKAQGIAEHTAQKFIRGMG